TTSVPQRSRKELIDFSEQHWRTDDEVGMSGAVHVAPEQVELKPTTILAVEIVGQPRLLAADEAGTLARITSLRRELIDPKIAEYHGRIIKKATGDGMLIEFTRVEDAVRCAVDVQKVTAQRNADVSENRRILFRMGVNRGNVLIGNDG